MVIITGEEIENFLLSFLSEFCLQHPMAFLYMITPPICEKLAVWYRRKGIVQVQVPLQFDTFVHMTHVLLLKMYPVWFCPLYYDASSHWRSLKTNLVIKCLMFQLYDPSLACQLGKLC